MDSLQPWLNSVFVPAFTSVAGGPADPQVRRSQHADFQVEGALALSHRLDPAHPLARKPRELAAELLSRVDTTGLEVSVAGPGYLNVKVSDTVLSGLISAASADPRLGVPPTGQPQLVTIDYSAPNVAKEMHVGHLRSTVIGDAAARVLEWMGHDVRRMNHVGDWGTPFGMLIEHLLDLGETSAAHELSVGDLDGFYKAARAKFNADPSFVERSRNRVVALQSGDAETLRLWRLLVAESQRYFLAVYTKLDVTLTGDHFYPESFYNDMLHPVVAELEGLGLLRDSDGARCVFPAGFTGRDGAPLPIIVRKRDGGFGYGATDLATIRYRTQALHADRMLYLVGVPQRQHFAMVFQAAREAGWLDGDRAVHIGFGSVLGDDGKMLKSRSGDSIKLIELLDEAVARAAAIVASSHLSAEEQASVAHAVGIGAVKYADLSTDKIKDYVFDWDRMLATNGDTAAYLQYSCARISSIFAKGGVSATPGTPVHLDHPSERALALELLAFPEIITGVAATLEFQKLTTYLFGLAGKFSSFYLDCPVLKARSTPLLESRLVLCDLTRRTLALGLDLLGIQTPARM